MDTHHPGYSRCAYCGEIKQVTDDGLLQAHNRYQADGTSVETGRCPGSDRPYQEAASEPVSR
jgi:hypothetical protein